MSANESLGRAQELAERLRSKLDGLERSPRRVTSTLPSTSWLRSQSSRSRSRPRCSGRARMRMRAPDALFRLADGYLADLELTPELGSQQESMRYAHVAAAPK